MLLNCDINFFFIERKYYLYCLQGDSGSPLVYNNTLIGIFSWTKPCAIGFPDVFTRISHFTDFIIQAMLDLDQYNQTIVDQNNYIK